MNRDVIIHKRFPRNDYLPQADAEAESAATAPTTARILAARWSRASSPAIEGPLNGTRPNCATRPLVRRLQAALYVRPRGLALRDRGQCRGLRPPAAYGRFRKPLSEPRATPQSARSIGRLVSDCWRADRTSVPRSNYRVCSSAGNAGLILKRR